MQSNRTDRILILIALAILLMAGSLFYFDNWMWGGRRNRGERIGVVSDRMGDVRVKFEGDLKWQRAGRGQDLIYNDSIYAGESSDAKLQLGNSEMDVQQNTLVVLRRENSVNFMNLSFGNLFGKIGKNEKIVIDTGDGRPIEFVSSSGAQIEVRKNGNHSEMKVTKGVADIMIGGKVKHVDQNSRIEDGKVEGKEKAELELVTPLHSQVFYSDQPAKIDFEWRWSTARAVAPAERYTVEFSGTPDFKTIHVKKEIAGEMTTSMTAADSLSLYYRVRGPAGEISPTEQVNFVRMKKPLIVKPQAQTRIEAPAGQPANVDIEFNRPENTITWFQIASDPQFNTVVSSDSTREVSAARALPPGNYFLRAKSDFGNSHETGWTDAVPFSIETTQEQLALPQTRVQRKFLIPNLSYPQDLYDSQPAKVKQYLSEHGTLKNFFQTVPDSKIWIKFQSGETMAQSQGDWPKEKMAPGRYIYRYQTTKEGYAPSLWSSDRTLEIADEPPRAVGDVSFGDTNKLGETEAHWSFTPLLFAASYDVEVSHDASMRGAREMTTISPTVSAYVSGENYWRARARDAHGRIISDYSSVYKLRAAVPQMLARNDGRRPAQAEGTTSARIERFREEAFEKNGWWGWVGLGDNYVDYRQSVPGILSLSDHHNSTPSEYIEMGFDGHNGWGGVFSYKHTPGIVNPDPAQGTIDNPNYNWDTYTAEGIYRHDTRYMIFGSPVVMGARVGLQLHHMPFIIYDQNLLSGYTLNMKYETLTDASAGLLMELAKRRWTYHWMMRYQYPLSTKADGGNQFSINPVFGFDGSVGISYNFTRQLKAGAFWYGQWHQFHFNYADGVNPTLSGFQTLFYSSFDLRMGWDF